MSIFKQAFRQRYHTSLDLRYLASGAEPFSIHGIRLYGGIAVFWSRTFRRVSRRNRHRFMSRRLLVGNWHELDVEALWGEPDFPRLVLASTERRWPAPFGVAMVATDDFLFDFEDAELSAVPSEIRFFLRGGGCCCCSRRRNESSTICNFRLSLSVGSFSIPRVSNDPLPGGCHVSARRLAAC